MSLSKFLSSEEIFNILILNVNYEAACSNPPVNPSSSSQYVVDKALNEDWKHTSSTWTNVAVKYRLFQRDPDDDYLKWLNTSTTIGKMRANDCNGTGYVIKLTYYLSTTYWLLEDGFTGGLEHAAS